MTNLAVIFHVVISIIHCLKFESSPSKVLAQLRNGQYLCDLHIKKQRYVPRFT